MEKRNRIDRCTDEEVLKELSRVAKLFNNEPFTRHDYDKHATKCKGSTVLSRFKTWEKALSLIGINKSISPKKWKIISDEQLFIEMKRIYQIVG